MPQLLLSHVDIIDSAIDALMSLPPSTSATCSRELPPELSNTWKQAAERGIFAFDSDAHGGPYRLIAVPRTPTTVWDLPESVGTVARAVVLTAVVFRTCKEITEADLRKVEVQPIWRASCR